MTATQVVGGTNTQREFNMGLEKKFLDTLYEMQQPGVEFPASYVKMAEQTGIPANIVGNVIQFLEDSNLLIRRFEWPHEAGAKRSGGRQAYWTLMTNHDHAANLLGRFHIALTEGKMKRSDIRAKGNPWLNGNVKGGRPKAETLPEPIIESAPTPNPEPISGGVSIDKARELVASVRQYMRGNELIQSNLQSLRDAGIVVNEEAYLESVSIKPDATAEAIALVMPYISYLEQKLNK